MATVNYTTGDQFVDAWLYTVTPLTTTNADSQALYYQGSGDRSIQITGTFGVGGTVIVEGTNDGTNWFQLRDPSNAAISFTAAGIKAILENCWAVRARVTAGDGTTAITAIFCIRRNRNG